RRRRRASEEVALRIVDAEVAEALELLARLDSLGDDPRAEVSAQAQHVARDDLLSSFAVNVAHEGEVELDDCGLELDEALEVGVAGAEVVDDEPRVRAHAQLFEDALAELEVLHRRALGDLEIHEP